MAQLKDTFAIVKHGAADFGETIFHLYSKEGVRVVIVDLAAPSKACINSGLV